MMYRVFWTTNLGELHKDCAEDAVLTFVQSVSRLGFTPRVEIVDVDD
jgi:hypothetical protein